MARNDLDPPTENTRTDASTVDETTLILRLAEVVEQFTLRDLRCFTPKEAGEILGKTENWVIEAIQDRRIPFTYVGKSPRLTAAHIRQIQEQGEVQPSKYAKPARAAA